MQSKELKALVNNALEDAKARDVAWLDVRRQTDVTDYMVVASGTSSTHVKSVVRRVIDETSQGGTKPIGVEGMEGGEWVLIDLADVVVHVMLPKAREFYDLESLWSVGAKRTERTV